MSGPPTNLAYLGCWARKNNAPAYDHAGSRDRHGEVAGYEAAYSYACGQEPADDLGLCPQHRRQILGVTTDA